MKSPFKFLDAYTLEDKDVFFGRDKEVEELYGAVSKNRLVLVYGQSGTGKTSLVQCGLASRFDATDWYPLFIRRQDDINRALQQALDKAAKRRLEGGLVDGLQRLNARFLRPIYLIFDQLEELLILGGREEQQAFIHSLQQILQAGELSCHLILILREEYIAHLYAFEQAIPTLFDRRLRVEPMTNTRVREVLRSSFAAFNISLEQPEENLAQIIGNVSAGRSGIQLPYLQVYLDMLWRRSAGERETGGRGDLETGGGGDLETGRGGDLETGGRGELETGGKREATADGVRITNQLINEQGRIEEVLEKFLQEQEVALQRELEQQYPGFPEQAVRQILDAFVTAEGTKRPVGFRWEGQDIVLEERVAKLLPEVAHSPSAVNRPPKPQAKAGRPHSTIQPFNHSTIPPLTTCLLALEQRRLLRFSDDSIELAHDSLAELIDKRRTDEQRQLNEVKVRLAGSYLEWQRTSEYLTRKQLISIEPFLEKLPLEPHLEGFVRDSYAHNDAVEAAEKEKQRAELEKERKLRGEAETAKQEAEEHAEKAAANARQARRRTRLAWIISALAFIIAGIAIWAFKQAQTANNKAKEANEVLEAKQDTLDLALSLSEQRRIVAEQKDSIAQERTKEAQLSKKTAQEKAREALQNLNNLEQASEEIATLLIADAKALVYELHHEEALEKLRAAVPLNKKVEEVARGLAEMAFFYNRAGKRDLALGIADTVAILKNNRRARSLLNKARDGGQTQRLIDTALLVISPDWHDALMERYYPILMPVEGGGFCMGRDPKETGACDTSQYAQVTLNDFHLAKTETTAWQFYLFSVAKDWDMEPPSWGWEGDSPVVNVNWYDAVAYANWASESLGLEPYYAIDSLGRDTNNLRSSDEIKWIVTPKPGTDGFRLPTDAEWEYAARGGEKLDTFIYSGDDSLDLVAWHYYNSNEEYGVNRTHTVGKKKANGLGLFDMSGNVWEWCWDWHGDLKPGIMENPLGPVSGSVRVLRGGSWNFNSSRFYEVTYRSRNAPYNRLYDDGFRLSQD